MMKVLITAGGTTEKIDNVRGITNFSTGRLGSLIADEFNQNKDTEVIYIHGLGADLPKGDKIRCLPIESTRELLMTLKSLLIDEKIDVVIHSMAISDYYSVGTATTMDMTNLFSSKEQLTLDRFWSTFKNSIKEKISSKSSDLIVHMKKNPKVISHIKEWSPETHLIGFKLLVSVSEDDLVQVAQQTLLANHCEYVLANDKELIEGDQHVGLLVNQSGVVEKYQSKQDIAKGLAALYKGE